MKKVSAKEIFYKNYRFDLIYKYLFLKYKDLPFKENNFFRDLYLYYIKIFNGFKEDEKSTDSHFEESFLNLFLNLEENGYDITKGLIPLNNKEQLVNGAHRLTSCYYLNQDVFIDEETSSDKSCYDYNFFMKRGFDKDLADYGVLEFVKNNPHSFVINIQPKADISLDQKVEKLIKEYSNIYYKKNVKLNLNGLINIKKLCYKNTKWIGNHNNGFAGAQEHAENSFSNNPMRVYVITSENLDKVIELKAKIRKIYNINNYSIHINDTHEEAIELAEVYFNDNTLKYFNQVPFNYRNSLIEKQVAFLEKYIKKNNIDKDDVCIIGSYPMGIFGLRQIRDLDFICSNKNIPDAKNQEVNFDDGKEHSLHKEELDIIYNPRNHFYYEGIKVITLDELRKFKEKRLEDPKDINDIKLIKSNDNGSCFKFSKRFNFARTKYLIKSRLKSIKRFIIQIKFKKDITIIRFMGIYFVNKKK